MKARIVISGCLLALFGVLVSCGNLAGQTYYFRNYQVSDGLSSNTVTCILQDSSGFLWFGTRNGLNRFDGSQFRQFRNDAADKYSIGSNSVLCLAEDARQMLWVGTHEGIFTYDPVHERFSRFGMIPPTEVRYIVRDRADRIWFIADGMLYRCDPRRGDLHRYEAPGTIATALTIGENGKLWYATLSGLLRQYDEARDRFIEYNIAALQHSAKPVYVQTIYGVSDSLVLVATQNQALRFDPGRGRFTNIFQGQALQDNIQVHKIVRLSPDHYWLGTENGLCILNPGSDKAQLIRKQYADPYSINDNVITDFCKDKEGSVWVGTFFGGVNYYSRQQNLFRKYFPVAGVAGLSGNLVHEICQDKYDNLWIGTEDEGLNKLDRRTGVFTHYYPGKGPGHISYQNIHGLLADGDSLWIGTYEHGLDLMDLRSGKVVRHFEKGSGPGALGGNFIVTIYKTRDQRLLIGTWNGLYVFDRKRGEFHLLPHFNRQAQTVLEDREGTLWVGSYGEGVNYYNEKTGMGGSFHYDARDSNSLSGNYVNNLYEDRKGNIWICTESGLCRLDKTEKRIVRCTEDAFLRGNQVFRVMEDDAGRLWVSTSRGLIRIEPGVMERKPGRGAVDSPGAAEGIGGAFTKVYTTEYGLLSDQFNYNSSFRDRNGDLYFGTVKGMISFNPAAMLQAQLVPPVYITGLQVNNSELRIGDSLSRLPQALPYTSAITLPYDSSTISIQAAALSYTMPAVNEYRYRMEGLDKDWVLMRSNRKIYYTKLPPGDYLFRIQGSSAGEVWNRQETTLAIHVKPPLWASPVAYLLYAGLALAIVLIILRFYQMALREKEKRKIKTLEIEKEREIYNAKIEFFTNITHEIRTPLTLIKLPVEKLLKYRTSDPILTGHLAMIDNNTNRLIHLTDQLLDFRKAEANHYSLNFVKTDINELLRELFSTYRPIAEEKGRSFRLEMPRVSLLAYVDPEAFRKILSNLFSNAIKYAQDTILVRLAPFSSEDTEFHITFSNDGILVPAELKEKIFEPFFRMKQTEKFAGTGIGLPLSRSLAELHKGRLELQPGREKDRSDSVGAMNVFCLSIPIHQQNEIDLSSAEPETAAGETEDGVRQPRGEGAGILIVEDNKEIANFLQKELQDQFNIYRASNGQEALGVLNDENIQLVISDIMMPVMDGIELCSRIKSDIQYSHIPIVLLTARNTIKSRIEGLEKGADAYIEKPFLLEHLLAQVRNLLQNRKIVRDYYAHSPLAHISRMAASKADTSFLEELQRVIDTNITNMDLDVDTLARMMNMSRGTFYRKIKGISDLTPGELITISRLKKAAELLAEGRYKITEVAHIVGYHLNSNFSRDFSKQFGMSPSLYLKGLQEKKSP